MDGETVNDDVKLCVGVDVSVALCVRVGVRLELCVVVAEGVAVSVGVSVGLAVAVTVGVKVPEGDVDWLPVTAWLWDCVCEGVGRALAVWVSLGVAA